MPYLDMFSIGSIQIIYLLLSASARAEPGAGATLPISTSYVRGPGLQQFNLTSKPQTRLEIKVMTGLK